MDIDLVSDLERWLAACDDSYPGDIRLKLAFERCLAEIIRLNDALEAQRHMHNEAYGRNSNKVSDGLFK